MKKLFWQILLTVSVCSTLFGAGEVWNADNAFAGWYARKNLTTALTPEGLKLSVTGPACHIGSDTVQLDAAQFSGIAVTYRATGFAEKPQGGRLFFATTQSPSLDEKKKIQLPGLIADGQWHTLQINSANTAGGKALWSGGGTITRLRLDIVDKFPGEIIIKSITPIAASPTAPAVAVPAPASTAPVTTGGWQFRNTDAGWNARKSLTATPTAEGLKLTITGPACHIGNYRVNLHPKNGILAVTYRVAGFGGDVQGGRLYFATEKSPVMNEQKKIQLPKLIGDGQWHTFRIHASRNAGGRALWYDGGAITKLRLDIVDKFPGEITILSIVPEESPEAAWREKMQQDGIPVDVPVQLGHKGSAAPAMVIDPHQPYFESPLAAPAGDEKAVGSAYLRREFSLKQAVKSALLQLVTDDQLQNLYVNGVEVKHSWSNSWQKSDRVDLTPYLKPGKNVLAFRYRNDGDWGGVMFDLGIVFADQSFQLITAQGALGGFRKVPENWYQIDFDGRNFTPATLREGPPHAPWTALPDYEVVRPAQGSFTLSGIKTGTGRAEVCFHGNPAFRENEIFYAHILKPDGSILAFRSGTFRELRGMPAGDGSVRIAFDDFGLLPYGGEMNGRWDFGVYGRNSAQTEPLPFHLPARPYPGKVPELKVSSTPQGPILEMDGKPFYFNILTVNHPQIPSGQEGADSPFNVVAFRAGGLREIWWTGPGQYDFSKIDERMNQLIGAYPNSKIALYVWCQPGVWYDRQYPERISRQANGSIMRYYVSTVTFSDSGYRQDAAAAITAFVKHCEENFGSKVILYNLMGGISCEWQGWNAHTSQIADYGPAARRDFAAFLKQRAPELADQPIPGWQERTRTSHPQSLFRDPVRERLSILYDEYYSESVADCIAQIAAAAKAACGGRKLVGAYYGYHMEYGDLGFCQQGGGHNALYRLLQSPDIDFLMSPPSYGVRSVGSPNADMKPFASIEKHGKFSLLEDDTRTHCTSFDGYYQALNPEQTRNILRRNLGMQLCRKEPLNHLPLVGGNDLDDPALRADFAKALAAGQKIMERNEARQAEIAVVIDEQSSKLLAFNRRYGETLLPGLIRYGRTGELESPVLRVQELTSELIYYQRIALGQIGAPVDYLLLEDAAEAAPKYKLLIVLDAFADSPALEKMLQEAQKHETMVLAVYGSGFMTGNGISAQKMSELLNIGLQEIAPGTLKVQYASQTLGGDYPVAPRFAVADQAATKLGVYQDGSGTAAAIKGKTAFYGGALLPGEFLRDVAKRANVHLYVESGDNLEAGCGALSLHSVSGGVKTVRLRQPAALTEIFTGETLPAPDGIARIPMKALESKVFLLNSLK